MKKNVFISTLLSLITISTYCQTIKLETKQSTTEYSINFKSGLDESLMNYGVFDLESNSDKVSNLDSFFIDIQNLNIEGFDANVKFKRFKLFDDNYSGNQELIRKSNFFKFNNKNSDGFLSVIGNYVYLRITTGLEEYYLISDIYLLGSKFDNKKLISFKKSDSKNSEILGCGINTQNARIAQNTQSMSSSNYCRKFYVACEADNEWINQWGLFGANAFIQTIMGNVSSYFSTQMNITVSISNINLWSSTDPYSNGPINGQTAVTEFRNYWNSNFSSYYRNAALMFSYRSITNSSGNSIGGITYSNSSIICTNSNAYAMVGRNQNTQHIYYSWLAAHELAHMSGHPNHDSTPNNIMHATLITSNTFTSGSIGTINTALYNGPDQSCIITGDIIMKLNGNIIQPYSPNNVCQFSTSSLSAPGNHSINWSFMNNTSGASFSSTSSTSANVYNGSNSGSFTVKANKSNDCGNIDRIFVFNVNNCASFMYYPNPTTDYLNIRFADIEFSELPDMLEIIDEKEEVLILKNIKDVFSRDAFDKSNKIIQFDLRNLSNGTYYLKVRYNFKKEFETYRILKN